MSSTLDLAVIVGSLRAGSLNRQLANALIGLAPASLSVMQSLRTTSDPAESRDARELAMSIAAMNDAVLARIVAAFGVADAANEQGVANFLAERDDMHKKWRWQLRASLGQPVG